MSATNHTQNYDLSQFVGGDIPSWLGDYNGDMSKIDTAIAGVAQGAGDTSAAVTALTSRINAAETDIDTVESNIATLQATQATQGAAIQQNTGNIATNANNITSLDGRVTAIEQGGGVDIVERLNSDGTSQGTPFYFDEQNGVYGYNTSSNRGADTFHPFKSAELQTLATNTTSYTADADYDAIIVSVFFSGNGLVQNSITITKNGVTVSNIVFNKHANSQANEGQAGACAIVENVSENDVIAIASSGTPSDYAIAFIGL